MPEAPSLWCDLGMNYYHQSRLLSCLFPEEDPQPLLEKALQVPDLRSVVENAYMKMCFNRLFWFVSVLAVCEEGDHAGQC